MAGIYTHRRVLIALLGFAYLFQIIVAKGLQAALNLNTYNLLFLMLGLILHWRPRSFTQAVSVAAPATAGVLIQFPFYAGIFGIISFSPISKMLANFFVHISNHGTYPLLVSVYSATLGFFVPSGGGKWLIEAPYVLAAANDLKVSPGWIVQVYNTAEALPNLINPFWMLPLAGHPQNEGPRPGRLWAAAIIGAWTGCIFFDVVFGAHLSRIRQPSCRHDQRLRILNT